jgi:Rrf2 family transcriptional regulator, nitric oxide-sensitive transcriptional repressor
VKLTTFTDYTLRVLMFLAIDPDRLATIPEIAAAYNISENHLMKVVHQLGRSGITESVRGKGGGIKLASDPATIRLGQIIKTSEGNVAIVQCLGEDLSDRCCIMPGCVLAEILVEGFEAFYASLNRYTLADLVKNKPLLSQILKQSDHHKS